MSLYITKSYRLVFGRARFIIDKSQLGYVMAIFRLVLYDLCPHLTCTLHWLLLRLCFCNIIVCLPRYLYCGNSENIEMASVKFLI